MERWTMAVPCLFGLEGLVGDELRRMGMEDVRVEDRRVFFTGGAAELARANIGLRMGERVMILLARFPARSFEELYQGVKAIPLERFVPREGAFVGNEAPLHETMAAAMVNLARYRGRDFFWDPFCGSGTIVIEAALAALNRAPGLARKFAAQSWSCIPEDVWTQAREAARAAEFRGEYRILGTDIDSGSLAIAIANAKKAGVSKYIEFREADATRESLPCDHGVIVCNPPYGERMLEQRSAQQLMRQFGRHLRFADGWKKYIISSEPEFEHYFGKQATKKRKLYNGRLQCNVYMYF